MISVRKRCKSACGYSPQANVELWSARVNRDFDFWSSDDVADLIKDLTDGLGQVLATLQSFWPDEDVFAPASDEEIKGRLAIMIGGLNLSLASPQVFIQHLTDSVAAQEPSPMAIVTAAREIVESGRYEKTLSIHDVLKVLAKHQEQWELRLQMLRSYQEGTCEKDVQPLTEALQKIELQKQRKYLINQQRKSERTKELRVARQALPAHLHWRCLMRLDRYRKRDKDFEAQHSRRNGPVISFRDWTSREKRSRRQQVLNCIQSVRFYRRTGWHDHQSALWETEERDRKWRLMRRINYWRGNYQHFGSYWNDPEDRRKEVLLARVKWNSRHGRYVKHNVRLAKWQRENEL